MIDRPLHTRAVAGRLSRLALIFCAVLAVGACAKDNESDIFHFGAAVENTPSTAAANMDSAQAVAHYGSAYAANPQDKTSALQYAEALRKAGDRKRAFTVLRAASVYHSDDPEFLSDYGRIALLNGQASAAAKILVKADDPARPDWRVASARGAAYAQLGKYDKATQQFERALQLAPGNPSALSNLAMAKAATGDLKGAETLLRKANSMPVIDPKVKQNLAIVLRLQGRNGEAETLDNATSSPVFTRQTVSPAQSSEPSRTQIAATEHK